MGNPKAFLSINRKEAGYRPVQQRKYDFAEVELFSVSERESAVMAPRAAEVASEAEYHRGDVPFPI